MINLQKKEQIWISKNKGHRVCDIVPYISEALGLSQPSLLANPALTHRFKSSLYYTCHITPKGVTSGGVHLRSLVPGLPSSEEASQWWQAVANTAPI